MHNTPDDDLRKRLDGCRGLNTQQIGEQLADLELDAITRELMLIFAERTDVTMMRQFPLTLRHTMYGDEDISDWVLRYGEAGTTIDEADEDEATDGHVRWERWEDGVRLINDNVSALSLFYALRIVALGEDDQRGNGQFWFMAVNFADDPDPNRPGRLIGYLRTKVWESSDELDAFVAEMTLDKLMESRARVLAYTMADLGAAEILADSYLRWQVAGHDRVAQVDFGQDGAWSFRSLPAAEPADPAGGVTTYFTEAKAFLYAAGSREELAQQLVGGTAKLLGDDRRLQAFGAATRRMYSPGGIS